MIQQQKKLKKIITIVGATAVGKTAITIKLAKAIGTEIISADARQCYKHMNIGTAKPTMNELAQVKHHFIDFLPLQKFYSAGAFEQDALTLLEKLWIKYDKIILTGGSGLYLQALCQGLATMPTISQTTYARWHSLYKEKGLSILLQKLAEKDPIYYAQVDRNNPHRIIRALAVCQITDRPYTYFRNQQPTKRSFQVIKIGLVLPREILYKQIENRVDAMIDQGLVDEAKNLYAYKTLPCLQTIGYQELFGFFDKKYKKDQAIQLIKRNTRHYAKRQLTWLKRDSRIKWFSPTDFEAIKNYVTSRLAVV